MRALVLEEYGEPLRVEQRRRPSASPDGVVVEVAACGVCRSDWHAWRGHGEWADDRAPLGQVLGHEPAGAVVEVGDRVEGLREGDRVTVPFNLGDGTCPQCRTGHGNVCEDGWALGFEADAPGAFAEYVHVPAADHNVAPLPDGVPFSTAAALGCRYMTAFHALSHRVDLGGGDRLAVFGCGGLGLSAVQLGRALGARVTAVDVREAALDAAAEVGAEATVNADEADDVPAAVREATGGGAHVTLDALGSGETCRGGVESLRRRGTHLQAGLTGEAERGRIDLPTDAMARTERSFHGVRGMPPSRYPELLSMVESGVVDPGELVRREVSLEAVPDRLAAMSDYATTGIEVARP
ncbi:MAG: zinc-dependent alcohol dehydrogenase family protein [Halobacteriaceae archaeon]